MHCLVIIPNFTHMLLKDFNFIFVDPFLWMKYIEEKCDSFPFYIISMTVLKLTFYNNLMLTLWISFLYNQLTLILEGTDKNRRKLCVTVQYCHTYCNSLFLTRLQRCKAIGPVLMLRNSWTAFLWVKSWQTWPFTAKISSPARKRPSSAACPPGNTDFIKIPVINIYNNYYELCEKKLSSDRYDK